MVGSQGLPSQPIRAPMFMMIMPSNLMTTPSLHMRPLIHAHPPGRAKRACVCAHVRAWQPYVFHSRATHQWVSGPTSGTLSGPGDYPLGPTQLVTQLGQRSQSPSKQTSHRCHARTSFPPDRDHIIPYSHTTCGICGDWLALSSSTRAKVARFRGPHVVARAYLLL